MSANQDRDLAIADRFLSAFAESSRTSTVALFVGMYCAHVRGELPMSITTGYMLGNFKNGKVTADAIEGAVSQNYILKEKLQGQKHIVLRPTEKLLKFVRRLLEIEGPAWDAGATGRLVAEAHKRFEELRPELERDHLGHRIAMSAKTGRYIRDDGDVVKLKEFAGSLDSDDFIYSPTITSQAA